jgi:hypothetical protein
MRKILLAGLLIAFTLVVLGCSDVDEPPRETAAPVAGEVAP